MLVNAIEGIVENGRIRLQENVTLPENARVYVIAADVVAESNTHVRSPRLAHPEQLKDFEKQVVEMNPDATL